MTLEEELVSAWGKREPGLLNLQKLAAIARPRECPEGAVLFREGDDSPYIFVLLQGKVALEVKAGDHGSTSVYNAGPGELLGWSPVLGRRAMTATARATTPCRLAVLYSDRVAALIEEDPRFGVAFLRQIGQIVTERLHATRHCLAAAHGLGQVPTLAIPREGSD